MVIAVISTVTITRLTIVTSTLGMILISDDYTQILILAKYLNHIRFNDYLVSYYRDISLIYTIQRFNLGLKLNSFDILFSISKVSLLVWVINSPLYGELIVKLLLVASGSSSDEKS